MTVPNQPTPATEWVVLADGYLDAPACPCGNQANLSGFSPSTPDGAIAEDDWPPEGWEQHQTVTCRDCGRYFRQTTPPTAAGFPVAGRRRKEGP